MNNEKRLYVSLPKTMHEQIWKTSGKYKVNLIAQCFMMNIYSIQNSKKELKTESEMALNENKFFNIFLK